MKTKPFRQRTFIIANRLIMSVLLLFTSFCEIAQASSWKGVGIRIGYGHGEPDHLQGQRFAVQKAFWFSIPFPYLALQPYWDLSFARWHVHPTYIDQPRSVHIFALSPVLRLQFQMGTFFMPFIEVGIGPSFLEQPTLGHRHLGGRFAFQDQIGIGLSLDKNQHWLLSYHYIHYSNAGFYPPNQGIDIKHFFSLSTQWG
jgi:lipid A 3-O-deacylase